jgi:hypothetical protein
MTNTPPTPPADPYAGTGDRGSPRPSDPKLIYHAIDVATLVNGGPRVINLWQVWLGGFAIVERMDTAKPDHVRAAAQWAASQRHCSWYGSWHTVGSYEELCRLFGVEPHPVREAPAREVCATDRWMACMDLDGDQGPCQHGMDMITLLVDYRHGKRGEKALMCSAHAPLHAERGEVTIDHPMTRR